MLEGQQLLQLDTGKAQIDTLPTPSIDTAARKFIRYSPDSLQAKVDYGSDSTIMDNKKRLVHLIHNATVNYLTMELQADYIQFYMDSSIAIAYGLPDSTGEISNNQRFTDGNESFEFNKLRYNFKTQKGIIYDAVTIEGDLFIHGRKTKFIGAEKADTSETNDEIYNQGALITTCDHPVPHYGIRSSKIKIVPDKVAVIGSSNLEINGVPTPLWLPFGFFPVTSGRRSGLIFPSDYEYSESWGFGLRDVGYYFPISDHIDLKVLGDIYFNGSWGLKLNSNYRQRYKYSGSVFLGYSRRLQEPPGDFRLNRTTSFIIRVSHNQDAKAHPYRRLGGTINLQSNNYQSINENDAASALTNTYSSNFNYSRTFPDLPFSLSMGMNHSQNTNSGQITVNAPNIDFRMNRIYPLRSAKRVGKEKWYERITLQYAGNAKARITGIDTTFFTEATLEEARYGVQHRVNSDLSFDILKYLHITPSISYDETWFFQTREKAFSFDPMTSIRTDTVYNADSTDFIIVMDTTSFGSVTNQVSRGFTPYRHFSTGVSVNTQIFGTMQFKKGWLRGLRHVIKPTFSFFYEPKSAGDYTRFVQTDIRPGRPLAEYSIFEGGIYSAGILAENRATLNYSFNNIFEAKFWSKRDSTAKRIKLFDNIIVRGNYNIFADSLNFSPVSVSGTTRFFKGLSTLSIGARFDPYEENENGRRLNQFVLDTRGKLIRFDMAQFRLSTRITLKQLFDVFKSEEKEERTDSGSEREEVADIQRPNTTDTQRGGYRSAQSRAQGAAASGFFDLFNNFSISHNMVVSTMADYEGNVETMVNTNSINTHGRMQLTKNWSINVGNIGYDFKSKRLTYPDIGFSRDLHCWELTFSWQPERGTYLLHLGVKPGSLDFLKIPFRRNNNDSFGSF